MISALLSNIHKQSSVKDISLLAFLFEGYQPYLQQMSSTKEVVKKAIQMLAAEILSSVQNLQRSASETKSFGLTDARQIIDEYLENDELCLALDHLNYVVLEFGINLTPNYIERIRKIEKKLKVSHVWMVKPSDADVFAFYKLVESFNQRQKQVVRILQDLWKVEFPVTNMDWLDWHCQASEANVRTI